jgi:hypothetical protein
MGPQVDFRVRCCVCEYGDNILTISPDAHDSDASEVYLSDAHGRQVTPRISMPFLPPDTPASRPSAVESSSAQKTPKRRGRPPGSGQSSLRQQAVEAQDALERKKMQMGPGLDRGGSILVNEKRRQGLIDDNDEEGEVIDDEDV